MVSWFNTEVARLRALYPAASWEEIERELPRHARPSISTYAASIGLRRPIRQPRVIDDPIIDGLRTARVASGMSITELADRAGCDRAVIHKIEKRNRLSLTTLRKIASALELELVLVPKAKREAARPSPIPQNPNWHVGRGSSL